MNDLNVTLTQEIYVKSRPPEVRDLIAMPDPVARAAKAQELIAAGFVLCKEIDIWGMDAAKMMFTWAQLELPWVPNAAQPGLVNPLKIGPGPSTDMSKPWPNSIKVSVDAKDYPEHDPAVAPTEESLMGIIYQDGTRAATSAALDKYARGALRIGDVRKQDGKEWVFSGLPWAFGMRWFWQPKEAA